MKKIIDRIGRILLYWVIAGIFKPQDFIGASTLESKLYNYDVWHGESIGLDDAFDRWPHLFNDVATKRILARRESSWMRGK